MRGKFLFVLSLLVACAPPPADSDCEGMCQPAGPEFPGVGECKEGICSPTFADCSIQTDISTCAEACEAQGTSCVANGCGGYTYQLYYDIGLCEDSGQTGHKFEHQCDEAIEWQFNGAVKCCCEQE
ncbi:hypothetical protein [Enhygromyxa salina]|uniref:Lipoprotein n=1 Tax=Enhygromyxa salina TaxID=215803 RepID=A0A2S9Y3L7_9BACT|nr:hypothetical protein [Enhygromyxa salina]PRP99661.1 hypothetical protein ENSA7_63010 [Enhygromyxa salina]